MTPYIVIFKLDLPHVIEQKLVTDLLDLLQGARFNAKEATTLATPFESS